MYDKAMWKALNGICLIRNAFAHNLSQTFLANDPEFVAAKKSLTLHEGIKFYPFPFGAGDTREKVRKPRSDRQIFVTNVKLALIALMRDYDAHAPHSNQTFSPPPDFTIHFTPNRVHYTMPTGEKAKRRDA